MFSTKIMFQKLTCTTVVFYFTGVIGTFYTKFNATDEFLEFKRKYNKVYEDFEKEKSHYTAFVINLNAAAALNATVNDTIYVMNKYADLDPGEVEDRYSINLKTYNEVKDGDYRDLVKTNQGIEVNDTYLYNLRNAKPLFEKYKEEQGRHFKKGERDGYLHYYRFVKTLVEKNRAIYEGSATTSELDDKADILKQSQEFFY